MSGDAVRTAGRLAGFSSIIRRSVVAAGGAAIRDLEAPADAPEVEAVATAAETLRGADRTCRHPQGSTSRRAPVTATARTRLRA